MPQQQQREDRQGSADTGGRSSVKSECSETESNRPAVTASPPLSSSQSNGTGEEEEQEEPCRPRRARDDGRVAKLPSYCNLPKNGVSEQTELTVIPPTLPKRQPHVRRATSPGVNRRQPPPPPPLSKDAQSSQATTTTTEYDNLPSVASAASQTKISHPVSSFRRRAAISSSLSSSTRRRHQRNAAAGGSCLCRSSSSRSMAAPAATASTLPSSSSRANEAGGCLKNEHYHFICFRRNIAACYFKHMLHMMYLY